MAGHSKWANIRFRKGLSRCETGQNFTKLIREISVAARMGVLMKRQILVCEMQ